MGRGARVTWLARVGGGAGIAAGVAAVGALAGVLPPGVGLGIAGAALASVGVGIGVGSARPELGAYGVALCRARHPGRLALTFDDGPDPRSTGALLDGLARAGASATFFVLADRVRAHGGLLREMVAAGHEIGLHGREHRATLTWASPAAGERWLRDALAVIGEAGAPSVRWFRPPFGVVSPRVFAALAPTGLTLAWCSVRTGDGGPASQETIRERCRRAVATDIVLLHEGGGHARLLLPDLLDEWDRRAIRATSLALAMEEG